jgi:putative flavoprotein involved in K+ transport
VLEYGHVLDVANVVWATGYTGGFSWIDLPVFDEHDHPVHDRGIVAKEPGLYFVGLKFQYAETSSVITGVTRDAKHVVKALAVRMA